MLVGEDSGAGSVHADPGRCTVRKTWRRLGGTATVVRRAVAAAVPSAPIATWQLQAKSPATVSAASVVGGSHADAPAGR